MDTKKTSKRKTTTKKEKQLQQEVIKDVIAVVKEIKEPVKETEDPLVKEYDRLKKNSDDIIKESEKLLSYSGTRNITIENFLGDNKIFWFSNRFMESLIEEFLKDSKRIIAEYYTYKTPYFGWLFRPFLFTRLNINWHRYNMYDVDIDVPIDALKIANLCAKDKNLDIAIFIETVRVTLKRNDEDISDIVNKYFILSILPTSKLTTVNYKDDHRKYLYRLAFWKHPTSDARIAVPKNHHDICVAYKTPGDTASRLEYDAEKIVSYRHIP